MNMIGKRVLITRPREQAGEFAAALIAAGAAPVFLPVIEIVPVNDFSTFDHALQSLDQYDWLVLTSIHAVDAFFQRFAVLEIKSIPAQLRVAAVGARTANALSVHGIRVDHVPQEYSAEGVLFGLKENIHNKRFLLPQSNLANRTLADGIRLAGGVVDEVIAYQNVTASLDVHGLEELRAGVDVVTFASPSAVRNFIQLLRENGLDPFNLAGAPLFACIGPVTRKTAEDAGFRNLAEAKEYTTDGLVKLLGDLVH
jgi:uroporphyrinogen III methyltransferase / synthase